MVVADVGGTKALLRALAADGSIVAEVLEPTGPGTTGERLDRLVGEVLAEHPSTRSVAVAVPGLVDPEGRVVVSDVLPLLAGWRPRPTAAGAPVVVNDVRAALAATRAAAPQVRDLVVVVVGTGIAAGVVSGGSWGPAAGASPRVKIPPGVCNPRGQGRCATGTWWSPRRAMSRTASCGAWPRASLSKKTTTSWCCAQPRQRSAHRSRAASE